jgi:lipopolysaccharide transport system ATP-binding protein
MAAPVIRVENLSKRYHIGARRQFDTLRDKIMSAVTSPLRSLRSFGRSSYRDENVVWALRDVSFEVEPGEVVGIIGRNGAGKSTLLKVLTRITEPTSGRAELRGRVGSLLEVGTGFHPELTGRENIFLSGAILGMTRDEIRGQLDAIIDFSGVEKFIDTPVKRYSSGMNVRLGFAIAAHLQPEILLVDEVLAVGDVAFQKKCLGKMNDVAKGGRTVLFVSHNMAAVEKLCSRALLVESGRVASAGAARQVIDRYLNVVLPEAISSLAGQTHGARSGDGTLRITSFALESPDGRPLRAARSGDDTVFVLGYECRAGEEPRYVDVGITLYTGRRVPLSVLYCSYCGDLFPAAAGRGEFRCLIRRLPFVPGRYLAGARVTASGSEADWPRDGIGWFTVETGDFYGTGHRGFEGEAPILLDGEWSALRTDVPGAGQEELP